MAGSLASATSTRVDSASKHIVPCKVNTEYMGSLVEENLDNAMRELQHNKMKYCMHKDDIAIGLGRPMYGSSIISTRKRAYPSVISTLANMNKEVLHWIAAQNFMVTNFKDIVPMKKWFLTVTSSMRDNIEQLTDDDESLSQDQKNDIKRAYSMNQNDAATRKMVKYQVDNLPEFYFVGVSLGLAYAHPHSGDTVASVMIGGLRTVLNGAFQVHTNDLLMFYWDVELDLFEEDGRRKDRSILSIDEDGGNISYMKLLDWIHKEHLESRKVDKQLPKTVMDRRNFYERGNANYTNGPYGPISGKINVARIKPYMESKHHNKGSHQHFPMDKARIFGKAISNAQPYEMLDIMLSRQSI